MSEGKQIIGYETMAGGKDQFTSVNAATGEKLSYIFYKATISEVNLAAEKAAAAFQLYRKKTGIEKAVFLEAIAEEILNIGEELITVCCTETALPAGRIQGERMRTVNQLKMFANLLKEGSWVDARIETALPDRTPLPKPDLRFMQIALGPVLVFGASNFPLAFSVAGGDTASALAAGCPVIVKAHLAHPATSALIGKAIQSAAIKTNMPDGVFSLLFGDGITTGTQLAIHPEIKAIGFTGSYKGGKALFDAAVNRPVPIPVYAEMGSTNPVFILPGALKERADEIAAGFSGSVTLGIGQFCTNPGMLIYENDTSDFTEKVKTAFAKTSGGSMLTENIFNAYKTGVEHHLKIKGIEQIANGTAGTDHMAQPVLFKTNSSNLIANPELSEEIFGPASILIEADSKTDLLEIAKNLTGHLTATVHGTENDLSVYKDLLDILEQKVGRLVINGFPTGVEVCSAMVHGGPFPSTTDSRSTSVGTAAIYRFTRPVSYQDMPQSLLPAELKNNNELGIFRLVNGETTNKHIEK
ncbi:MAG: aldehyde dehydrogenase (NADP(+)) [Lacibacter sp.]